MAWLAVCYVAARGDDSITAITIEDLNEALERGDITAAEYEALYELVYSRAVADSAELARTSSPLTPLASESVAPVQRSSRPAHGYLRYSYFSPLRGSGSPRQYITAHPKFGAVALNLRLSRRFKSLWTVEEVSAHYTNRWLSLTGGVLAPRWTGGLLIGRAPVFLDHSGQGWRGLWLPGRGRLYGVHAIIKHRLGDVSGLHSSLSDSVYTHTVSGVRSRFRFGRLSFEPALIVQRLGVLSKDKLFTGRFWGLTGAWRAPSISLELDLAADERATAVQARG